MKTTIKMLAVMALTSVSLAFAGGTKNTSVHEKGKAAGAEVKRQGRKAVHRADEALCTGTKAECEAGKLKHRVNEAGTKVRDDARQLKDDIDPDGR